MTTCRAVLLRAPDETEDRYEAALSGAGWHVHSLPTLSFSYDIAPAQQDGTDTGAHCSLRTCLQEQQQHYAGLILTSPRAVIAVARALRGECDAAACDVTTPAAVTVWSRRPAFVVGERTAELAARLLHCERVLGANSGRSQQLARVIVSCLCGDDEREAEGGMLLFPVGNRHRPELPRQLIDSAVKFHTVLAYCTHDNPQLPTLLNDVLCASSAVVTGNTTSSLTQRVPACQLTGSKSPTAAVLVVVVVFSPSAVRLCADTLRPWITPGTPTTTTTVRLLAIGPTSAACARELGVSVAAVATAPCPQAVVEAANLMCS